VKEQKRQAEGKQRRRGSPPEPALTLAVYNESIPLIAFVSATAPAMPWKPREGEGAGCSSTWSAARMLMVALLCLLCAPPCLGWAMHMNGGVLASPCSFPAQLCTSQLTYTIGIRSSPLPCPPAELAATSRAFAECHGANSRCASQAWGAAA